MTRPAFRFLIVAVALVSCALGRLGAQSSANSLIDGSALNDVWLHINAKDWADLHTHYLDDTYYPVDFEWQGAKVRNAGSLFVGAWSAQVAGDYAIGSNHVLPTAGTARVRGGLSAADFVKQITVQRVTKAGLSRIGPSVVTLARAEGLSAHAESVATRLRKVAVRP